MPPPKMFINTTVVAWMLGVNRENRSVCGIMVVESRSNRRWLDADQKRRTAERVAEGESAFLETGRDRERDKES